MGYIDHLRFPDGNDYSFKLKNSLTVNGVSYDGTSHVDINVGVIDSREYTNVYSLQDNDAKGIQYYGRVRPDAYKVLWKVKFHVVGYVPTDDNFYGDHIFQITGMRNTYSAYACWNDIQDTSYRVIYYHNVRFASNQSNMENYGHIIGLYLRSCSGYTNPNKARTFKIELLECENCTFEFFDSMTLYEDIDGTGTFNGNTLFNATGYGLRETGDEDTITISQQSANYMMVANDIRVPYMCIFGYNRNNEAVAISNYYDGYTSYTTKTNTDRIYASTGIDYTKGMALHNAGTSYAPGATITSSIRTYYSAIDFRYTDNVVPLAAESTLGLKSYKAVYFRGVIKPDGLFYLRPITVTYSGNQYERAWTQDIPTSVETDESGLQYTYWYVGFTYYNGSYPGSQYQLNFFEEHPMYWFNNGRFEEYVSASIVNGHTVNKDVPEDAVFTDTVTSVENVLTSDSTENALSAAMGKQLYGMIGTSGFAPTLIWENSTPTTAFAAQTVSLDTSAYSWLIVSAAINTSATASTSETLIANNSRIHRLVVTGTQAVNSRTIEFTGNTVVFGAGYASGQQGNSNVIPLKIWGI